MHGDPVLEGLVQGDPCTTLADCLAKLEIANRRINKILADLDNAIDTKNANAEVIAAYQLLRDLLKEGLAIKDGFIADLKADNDFLRKQVHPSKSWYRKVFETVEKFLYFAAGTVAAAAL